MQPSAKVHLYDFHVRSNEAVGRDVFRMVMESPELAGKLAPGQFMNIAVPGDASHIVRIPLSFAGTDVDDGTIELVYAVVGEGTRRLSKMGAGSGSTVVGPCGNGWRIGPGGRALAVAGGVGAPPVIAAARALVESGRDVDVILGAQTRDRLWGEKDARGLGASDVVVTTDDGSYGLRGFTTQAMEDLLAQRDYGLVVTCGPSVMMAGVARLAQDAHVACQASLERMMTCGFGACSTCNVAMRAGGYKSCCMDGPVFDAQEVAW
ncbi:dihydroorotate dehydrogenase electron transfer subunit [Parafannyhessea umbonata]|uniref:Dihydroorotate oxidase B, electron transfer subunit n=1 Tax=Parafannyhessea umbonata TaxID=604330 RepID=A0A1H1L8W9_9ACTN|nr:dihydroorotate dehydrogenase electron transfer subunit [Parafannyhessea umbonata]SDR70946.1 dihydroorotate oxidase B, electron transfer subunit [Parafannyhessea umbonata]